MIIIDSNVWIFAESENAPEHSVAARAVQNVLETEGVGINVTIVSEVFHVLSRVLLPNDSSKRVRNILRHPAVEWLDCGLVNVERGILLSEKSGIRINDAVIAQQALEHQAAILTDNVRDFRRVRGLRVMPLR